MSNERERLVKMLEAWAEARDEDARLSDPLSKLRDETIRIARDLRRAAALLREPREAPAAECCDGPVQASCPEGFGVPCSPVVPREAPTAEPDGLRLCPFCGAEPYVTTPGFPGDEVQIGCDSEQCGNESTDGEGAVWRNGRTYAEAAARWNRRAGLSAPADEREWIRRAADAEDAAVEQARHEHKLVEFGTGVGCMTCGAYWKPADAPPESPVPASGDQDATDEQGALLVREFEEAVRGDTYALSRKRLDAARSALLAALARSRQEAGSEAVDGERRRLADVLLEIADDHEAGPYVQDEIWARELKAAARILYRHPSPTENEK